MGQPKKKTTRRSTGNRRSHLLAKLQRAVNRDSPVKVAFRRKKAAASKRPASKKSVAAKKPAAKKPAPKKRSK